MKYCFIGRVKLPISKLQEKKLSDNKKNSFPGKFGIFSGHCGWQNPFLQSFD